ncbi:ParB/RepB/Spo0J family partition protein [Yoonia litorea]|uniref:Chromosome partitioning protein, ParB family n=1 Tax=Yoonia litorea TaxID=1123755 RepID=A0A1I6MVU9_9RHOB|nr:ParB/RepB/Spo0J family partition protein [Yoonia litorea]SFS19774.1 chromosome partitioning protein, ParB family [Yoonia litorea]
MARNVKKSRGLGRGLSALMSDVATEAGPQAAPKRPDLVVPIEQVRPNPDQPRRYFAEDALQELAASVAEKGIIQPLIVRTVDDGYEIVAGERRWRAAQMSKLHEVPVIVREYDDTEVLEIAIIENIQRADLNPIDEAAGYKQLMDRFGHTQDKLAQALGKSRSHIANAMRLLNLPEEVQDYLTNGLLTAGHARALIGHDDARLLARKIINEKLSVRQAEALVKKGLQDETRRKTSGSHSTKDADTVQIEKELGATLKMKVSIDHAAGTEGGKMTISYRSLEQLDDLLRVLSGN